MVGGVIEQTNLYKYILTVPGKLIFPGFLFYFYILVYEIQFERISNDFLQSRLGYKQVKYYSN